MPRGVPFIIGTGVIIKKGSFPGMIVGEGEKKHQWKVEYQKDGKCFTELFTNTKFRHKMTDDPDFVVPVEVTRETEPQPESQIQPQPELKLQAQTHLQSQPQTQPQPQAQPQIQTQPEPETQPESQTQPQLETQPQPHHKSIIALAQQNCDKDEKNPQQLQSTKPGSPTCSALSDDSDDDSDDDSESITIQFCEYAKQPVNNVKLPFGKDALVVISNGDIPGIITKAIGEKNWEVKFRKNDVVRRSLMISLSAPATFVVRLNLKMMKALLIPTTMSSASKFHFISM